MLAAASDLIYLGGANLRAGCNASIGPGRNNCTTAVDGADLAATPIVYGSDFAFPGTDELGCGGVAGCGHIGRRACEKVSSCGICHHHAPAVAAVGLHNPPLLPLEGHL